MDAPSCRSASASSGDPTTLLVIVLPSLPRPGHSSRSFAPCAAPRLRLLGQPAPWIGAPIWRKELARSDSVHRNQRHVARKGLFARVGELPLTGDRVEDRDVGFASD